MQCITQLYTGTISPALQLRLMRILPAKARRGHTFLAVGLLMTLALSACGGSAMSDMKDVANSAVDAAKEAVGFNDDDVMFAQAML
jgi:hypothetical protein